MSRVHIDLFSGIGGFAYAADQVWPDVEHIFCDNDKFSKQVLAKHWPESEIYDNVKTFITDSQSGRRPVRPSKNERPPSGEIDTSGDESSVWRRGPVHLLTGGFPCQPFSAAGARRGTDDDRWLWPEMLAVIRSAKPTWVIAENVGGFITWNDGMVFEQVCADLEDNGYEVQPFIIPAAAVGAPHRRDRVWFVAHSIGDEHRGRRGARGKATSISRVDRSNIVQSGRPSGAGKNASDTKGQREQDGHKQRRNAQPEQENIHAAYAGDQRPQGSRKQQAEGYDGQPDRDRCQERHDWAQDWTTLATELCSVDDGLPASMGDTILTKSAHRAAQLKAYGNAIVPQVAQQIMEAMP